MITLEELAILANTTMIADEAAVERMRIHQKVHWDPSTDLYSYKAEVLVNSKDAIIHEIQRLSKGGAGVSVKVLKESWKGSAEAIKELEKDELILVMRAGKNDEKNAKFVFWNTQSREAVEEMKIDDEFRKLWAEQVVPEEADVVRALNSEGLSATVSQNAVSRPLPAKKKSRKGARPRPIKLTNTHITGIDLSQNYIRPS